MHINLVTNRLLMIPLPLLIITGLCVQLYQYLIKFIIFMLFNKNSLDRNEIGDKGSVALGEALKVNMTLQTLK